MLFALSADRSNSQSDFCGKGPLFIDDSYVIVYCQYCRVDVLHAYSNLVHILHRSQLSRFRCTTALGKCVPSFLLECAIDEAMVKYKGRSSLKQYLPMKPIKRGFKVWVRPTAPMASSATLMCTQGRTALPLPISVQLWSGYREFWWAAATISTSTTSLSLCLTLFWRTGCMLVEHSERTDKVSPRR